MFPDGIEKLCQNNVKGWGSLEESNSLMSWSVNGQQLFFHQT